MATSNPTIGPTPKPTPKPNASIRVLTDKDGNMISPVTSFDSVFTSTGGGIKEALLDYIYPVGSIYMSANNVNPGTFLGGTWTQITDKFLLAAGSTYTAGNTGGSATKTIAKENIPNYTLYSANHSHTFTGSSSSFTASGTLYKDGLVVVAATANGGPNWKYRLEGANGLSTYTNYYTMSVSGSVTAKGTNSSTPITVTSGGSGTAMDIMPPYEVVYTWKRTA